MVWVLLESGGKTIKNSAESARSIISAEGIKPKQKLLMNVYVVAEWWYHTPFISALGTQQVDL